MNGDLFDDFIGAEYMLICIMWQYFGDCIGVFLRFGDVYCWQVVIQCW
jgi:hypothetical protein